MSFGFFCFFKQKTADGLRISDWSSDVCSADLILPEAIDLATPPNLPGWSISTLDKRRPRARSVVAAWETAHDAPIRLRIALPDGPGATLLFGRSTASLTAVWVGVEPVPRRDAADQIGREGGRERGGKYG